MNNEEHLQEIEQVENELRDMMRVGHYIKFETYCEIRNLLNREREKILVKEEQQSQNKILP